MKKVLPIHFIGRTSFDVGERNYALLIWLDKIKVAEKVKAIKETESSEEF